MCSFHEPEIGDTTVLDVKMVSEGSKVAVTSSFSHLGYLEGRSSLVGSTLGDILLLTVSSSM